MANPRPHDRPPWQRATARVLRALKADPYGNFFEERTSERLRKLLSPRYLLARASLATYERQFPDVPWITRDAVWLLEGYLNRERTGFEWGSGNGTAWLLKRSKSLTSVEHHAPWSEKVKKKLEQAGVTNADYRFVEEREYMDIIDTFPDEHFDYVIVDGLFRDVATSKSMPKLKHCGLLVLDNANWFLPSHSATPQSRSLADGPASALWGEVHEALAGWATMWTTNGVNDTAIFVKP